MRSARLLGICGVVLILSGVSSARTQQPMMGTDAVPGILPSGFGATVDRDVTALRAATARFRDAAQAAQAGYPAVTECVAHPGHGGMGLHYMSETLRDVRLEVERPEVLVYERLDDGALRLNGVEYIVPISAWSRSEAPRIMGQDLKRADALGIWYLHVWNWTANPSGLFADWNPVVKCRG